MKLSKEQKKELLEGFIDIFTRISNKEYQKRVWIQGGGTTECDDFDDTVNDFFESYDFIIDNYQDLGINKNQHDLLIKFHDEFEKFSDRSDLPQDFIDFPEWEKITCMAQEVLSKFNYKRVR